ncbi:hypothetical protein BG015_010222 [Linnemannia schmuckeri]|uniref:Protein kinase domain-containing protein n=1 Tax=Linnemannia schmuckeri TaxID=64567 RepID=A0A9P5RUD0_9FUNG|nr:hypothetical protein BG015_010222 [Linnemannia schmuckeri]
MAVLATQDDLEDSENEAPLETDPTNRFQRCDEILGEGAYKLVYRACDLEEGNEVAWNQLRFDHLSKREAQKILSEIEILQSIRNDHIINFYASWSTPATHTGGERIVFITELMSSGTLKQYLKKTLKGALKPKVVKSWCRQILQGLAYLHTHSPPIIHRDLKCDNIFINGNNGQLKIGDLGLAVVRHRTHVSSVLGTPEFMAPELYDEKYDEKVDIYAFGMCVLEMVTKDYPYAECTNQAQIYRKVSQGIKPQALEHVQDPEIREFIDRCLDHDATTRPSAQELLDSDFLKPCAAALSSPYGLDSQDMLDTLTQPSLVHSTSFSVPLNSASSLPISVSGIIPSRIQTAAPVPVVPRPDTIPAAEFTLTTVDVDNKTYHIRSNILPPTPPMTSHVLERVPSIGSEALLAAVEAAAATKKSSARATSAHSHGSSNKMCSIQVVQYGQTVGSRLNLKMECTCPVVGGGSGPAGTHEIKFPFDTDVDTVEEVVAEMIREQILSAEDQGEAVSRIQELVTRILITKQEEAKRAAESLHAVLPVSQPISQPIAQGALAGLPSAVQPVQLPLALERSLSQQSRSTLDALPHIMARSNSSSPPLVWGQSTLSPESDQGYASSTSIKLHQSESPVPLTMVSPLFKPAQHHPSGGKEIMLKQMPIEGKPRSVTYSDVTQLSQGMPRSLSPLLQQHNASRGPTVGPSRPKSVHDVSYRSTFPVLLNRKLIPDNTLASSSSTLPNPTLKPSAARPIERSKSNSNAIYDKDEDVGYTSPFRHGVSSSSIKSHGFGQGHTRSPSCELGSFIPQPMGVPTSLRIFNPPEASINSDFRGKAPSEAGYSMAAPIPAFGKAVVGRPSIAATIASSAPVTSFLVREPTSRLANESLTTTSPQVLKDDGLSPSADATPAAKGTGSDSGISSGASSPSSTLLENHTAPTATEVPFQPTVASQDLLSPFSATSVSTSSHSHSLDPMSSSLTSEGLYPILMTHEAKKKIELWSDHVQQKIGSTILGPEDLQRVPHTGSLPSSSCTDMSDEEEEDDNEDDEDLRLLKEQQRKELEWMRLQHEMQWEEMMKLKEQRDKTGEPRMRRTSQVSGTSWPTTMMDSL